MKKQTQIRIVMINLVNLSIKNKIKNNPQLLNQQIKNNINNNLLIILLNT